MSQSLWLFDSCLTMVADRTTTQVNTIRSKKVASKLTNARSSPHALFPITIRAVRDVRGLCW
jgi:hypothetical protein